MIPETQIENRRAIEALRAGVPNRDAVRFLGSSQLEIEEKFRKQLQATREGFRHGQQAGGILISGNFGTGKSHLLEYLQHIALEENFICSKFIISKETTLHDPAKMLRAAAETMVAPDRKSAGLTEIATKLKFENPAYVELYKWVNRPDTMLSSRFAATLFIFERYKNNPDVWDRIIRFWSGDPMSVTELKNWLLELGELATYKIDKVTMKELVLQRYKFLPRLIIAAGYSGWLLLIDEVELIGRYSFRQRAKSYAEIARWMGKLEGISYPGLTTVLTIIPIFESLVLHDRDDYERIPQKLRASGTEIDLLLAAQAEHGMRIISKDKTELSPPTPDLLHQIYEKIRSIYATAYNWEPPIKNNDFDMTSRLRQHIKKWINEWDLRRLYSGYEPEIEITKMEQDLTENPELESLAYSEPLETSTDSSNIQGS